MDYSGMVRWADQETAAIEKIVAILTSSKRRVTHATPRRAIWGSARVGQETESGRQTRARDFYCSYYEKEWAGQGKQIYLAGLNHFSSPWGIGTVSSGLVLGLWWLGQRTVACRVRTDKGSGWGSGLWIGWFAPEGRIHRQVIYCL